ncbi:DNA-binding transcriptional MocR family regulator [Serinibacter salmoneus]|uniref:DNA-binding transcriptional MocR family regulator n=1 Tax=Serinibacter salmoneus TaxID=556530 RepID=A0A2A9D3C6_9MICO|nr:DNA-binding transcriptional MocR family regulator [Serinibacter salmoneus]
MTESPRGTRLDPWHGSYAARTQGMRASEIRSLFAVANRPEVVSLAGGMPNLADLPMERYADTIAQMLRMHGSRALQYGSGQGEVELRERITEVMSLEAVNAHPDDVVVTTGSQQALDLLARIFLDPGDVVVAEAPSYVGALGVFRAYEADVVHTPMDDEGLVPEAFEETLSRLKREGRRVKVLYTIPNFQNPGGVTMSLARRHAVIEVARRHGVLILEDDPYGLLSFDGEPLPAMASIAPDDVVFLGSFSKTFAPGYRVGWAHAPHAIRERLVLANESAILCPSNASQLSVAAYLANFDWRAQIKDFRVMYAERRDALVSALAEYIPNASWTTPEGGFFVWVRLPAGLDAREMLPRAVTARVAYVPGTAFFADGAGSTHMRLSFCYPTPERIVEGVRRLAGVVNAEADLVAMFGSTQQHPHGLDAPATGTT